MRHHDVPEMASQPLDAEFLASQDCVLIATDHSAYDYDFIVRALAAGDRHAQRHEGGARRPRENPQSVKTFSSCMVSGEEVKIRTSNIEIRNKHEIRNQKQLIIRYFEIRDSDLFRISRFGFRT